MADLAGPGVRASGGALEVTLPPSPLPPYPYSLLRELTSFSRLFCSACPTAWLCHGLSAPALELTEE